MEVATVKKQIVEKQFDSFYIFAGDELELMWTYIHKICDVSGKKLQYEDSYPEVLKKMRTPSFIKQSFVYVIRDDSTLLKEEKLWDALKETRKAELDKSIVILLLSDVDKRLRFYKTFKDRIVEFEPMAEQVLIKHIQARVNLSENRCKRLISVCSGNYGRIVLEVDKIARYARIAGFTPDLCFDHFLEEGLLYEPPRDMIFEFVKQFLLRKPVPAFQLYQECIEGGEPALVMLSVLYTNTRQTLQVQICDSNNIAATTGLTAWQVKNAKEVSGHYTSKELVKILKRIQELETGIKTGDVEDIVAVPYLLSAVM